MAPHDAVSAVTAVQFSSHVAQWAREHDAGTVYDSNGGFEFPDGDELAPDPAFVPCSRNPDRHLVEVHRSGEAPEILGDDDRFAPPEMPGLSIAVRDGWPRRRAGEAC